MLQQNPRDVTAMTGETIGIQLERLDVLLGKLGMGLAPEEALEIPVLLDQVYRRMKETDPESQGGKGSAAQFETYSQTYKKNLAVFLREVGDPAKLAAARLAANPPPDQWWWQPEQMLAQERKAGTIKVLRGLAITVAIIAVLVIVYQLFLRPSPQVIAVMDTRREAEQLMAESGDTKAALARVEQGLSQVPGDSELLVLKGCLLTMIGGRETEARAAFSEAEKSVGSHEYVLLMSAQNYTTLYQPALAKADAEAAIAINPKSAQGYLILGQALEDQKDQNGAYQAYEKASALGTESNDPTITAQARIKMGMLLQAMGMNSFTNATPTTAP
jgi:cytochrome c-type biogenesis protein CcmH/NrfG